jgi:hypothetical protein
MNHTDAGPNLPYNNIITNSITQIDATGTGISGQHHQQHQQQQQQSTPTSSVSSSNVPVRG